jgi:uncharacterized protein YcbK (DUF882 family)
MNWPYQHFRPSEFGAGVENIDPALFLLLDMIRARAGVPVHIHPPAFTQSGHSTKSQHYLGKAADFHFGPGLTHEQEMQILIDCLAEMGITGGLGFYPHWSPRPGWHIDVRDSGPVRWFRDENDKYHYGFSVMQGATRRADQ